MSGALENAPVLDFPVPQDVYRGSTYHSSSGYSPYSSGYSSSSTYSSTPTTTSAPAPAPTPAPPPHGHGHGRGHGG